MERLPAAGGEFNLQFGAGFELPNGLLQEEVLDRRDVQSHEKTRGHKQNQQHNGDQQPDRDGLASTSFSSGDLLWLQQDKSSFAKSSIYGSLFRNCRNKSTGNEIDCGITPDAGKGVDGLAPHGCSKPTVQEDTLPTS